MAFSAERDQIRIAIRADGGGPVGFGHLSRCSSLAKALLGRAPGARIEFWCRESEEAAGFLVREGLRYNPLGMPENLGETIYAIKQFSPDILILDVAEHIPDLAFQGWTLIERDYSEELSAIAGITVQLDDFARGLFPASIVVNGGVVEEYTGYDPANKAEFLIGPGYVLLRPEFATAGERKRITADEVKKILIVDSGHRFTHHIPLFLYAFEKFLKSPRITLVSRDYSGNPNRMNSPLDIQCVPSVSDMAAAMMDCDLAVTGGGTILYELAATGTPAVTMPAVKHQEIISTAFARIGTVMDVGAKPGMEDAAAAVEKISTDFNLRERMSREGRGLVDGLGAGRVAGRILEKTVGVG